MTDWTPLCEDGRDPVPGDPNEVHDLQAWFRRMADQVRGSLAPLQRLDVSAEWQDAAANVFSRRLDGLKQDLPKLRDSSERAAWGLRRYEADLRAAQDKAQRALNMALEAKAQVGSAERAKASVSPDQDTSSYDRQKHDGEGLLARARRLADEAHLDRDQAANACIRVIRDAKHLGIQNKSCWDHVISGVENAVTWVDDHLEEIAEWCSRAAAVLSLVALAISFVPFLDFATPFIEGAALAFTAVSLLANAELAREGRKSWGEVGVTALLTFGPLGAARVVRFARAASAAKGAKALKPGEFSTRLTAKISRQMTGRGWTRESIHEAISSGKQVRAINKANGNRATRYIHPTTRRSVVVDDITGEVIHVGGPGFKYGPESGDLP